MGSCPTVLDLFELFLTCGRKFGMSQAGFSRCVLCTVEPLLFTLKPAPTRGFLIFWSIKMNEKLDDLLFGAIAIGTFLGFKMPDEVDKVYRLADRKIIPVGRVGGPRGKMIGSKRRIAAALDKIASGEPV